MPPRNFKSTSGAVDEITVNFQFLATPAAASTNHVKFQELIYEIEDLETKELDEETFKKCQKKCWYSKDDYNRFERENKRIANSYKLKHNCGSNSFSLKGSCSVRSLVSDVTYDDLSSAVHEFNIELEQSPESLCVRGLENLLSIQNKVSVYNRFQAYHESVFQEQRRQREAGIKDHDLLSRCALETTEQSRVIAINNAKKDEQEVVEMAEEDEAMAGAATAKALEGENESSRTTQAHPIELRRRKSYIKIKKVKAKKDSDDISEGTMTVLSSHSSRFVKLVRNGSFKISNLFNSTDDEEKLVRSGSFRISNLFNSTDDNDKDASMKKRRNQSGTVYITADSPDTKDGPSKKTTESGFPGEIDKIDRAPGKAKQRGSLIQRSSFAEKGEKVDIDASEESMSCATKSGKREHQRRHPKRQKSVMALALKTKASGNHINFFQTGTNDWLKDVKKDVIQIKAECSLDDDVHEANHPYRAETKSGKLEIASKLAPRDKHGYCRRGSISSLSSSATSSPDSSNHRVGRKRHVKRSNSAHKLQLFKPEYTGESSTTEECSLSEDECLEIDLSLDSSCSNRNNSKPVKTMEFFSVKKPIIYSMGKGTPKTSILKARTYTGPSRKSYDSAPIDTIADQNANAPAQTHKSEFVEI